MGQHSASMDLGVGVVRHGTIRERALLSSFSSFWLVFLQGSPHPTLCSSSLPSLTPEHLSSPLLPSPVPTPLPPPLIAPNQESRDSRRIQPEHEYPHFGLGGEEGPEPREEGRERYSHCFPFRHSLFFSFFAFLSRGESWGGREDWSVLVLVQSECVSDVSGAKSFSIPAQSPQPRRSTARQTPIRPSLFCRFRCRFGLTPAWPRPAPRADLRSAQL